MSESKALALLEGSPVGALPDGPERIAERLVAVAHIAADWDVWGGPKAVRYWDALVERVRMCCYQGPTLGDWWEAMCRRMSVGPPARREDRELLAGLLACPDQRKVLDVLRTQAEALVLRVRVANDQRKANRAQERDDAPETVQEGML